MSHDTPTETPASAGQDYTLRPWVGADSGGAAEEGCYDYAISIERPGRRGFTVGHYEDYEQLTAAVERAQRDPTYLVRLLLTSLDLRVHSHEANRADWERERSRQRERLEVVEPAMSDQAGRIAGAQAALREAGELMQAGETRDAWLAVVRAADALGRAGGLSQEAAALKACRHVDEEVVPGAAFPRHAGVVSCEWDIGAGLWWVECRTDADPDGVIWEVEVTAAGAEVVNV